MKLLPIFVILSCVWLAGFMYSYGWIGSGIVVVQDRCESSFSLDKGTVYDVDLWVKNEASTSKSAEVKVELIVLSTGKVRDESTQFVNLKPDESRKLKFTLDGENGIDYRYRYDVKNL